MVYINKSIIILELLISLTSSHIHLTNVASYEMISVPPPAPAGVGDAASAVLRD